MIKGARPPFGVAPAPGAQEQAVKVRGPLSANNGEMVVQWAVDGRGIALRSMWDVAPFVQSGQLVQVLPEWRQEANIWAVYPRGWNARPKCGCALILQERFRHRPWANAAHIARGRHERPGVE